MMRKRTINLFVLGAAVLTLALFGCSSGNVADKTATGAAIDGAALYTSDCSGCHGPLAASGKKGASVSQIQDAIAHNWGGMGAFAGLTTDQLQAIATALAPVTTDTTNTPATAVSLDGAALYADKCSSCHGSLAASGKGGALASAIQAAITSNSGGMGRFSDLTTAQLQAIADALASVQAPPPVQTPPPGSTPSSIDGAALYTQYCSGCHGNSKQGSSAASIQNAINSNLGGMGSLSGLTSEQIQAIATGGTAPAPAPTPTPTTIDGAALYTQYCSGCHGNSMQGSSATSIQNAINSNRGGMGSLSGLTSAQIEAIATGGTAPASTPAPAPEPAPAPTPAPTDGAALYTQYCGSCHGSLAASSKVGKSAAQIQTAITNNAGGMGSLSNLTATQVQAIASALATAPTPAPTDGAALYTTYCSSCHGALATSGKRGRTATQIQSAITGNVGGMGSTQLRALTTAQVQAIATALGTTPAPTPTPTPTPTPAPTPAACGSCHAIPPASGEHSFHRSRATCATCHGTGYSTTAVNTATHNNGVINIASGSTPGWNPTTRSCSNSCHGTQRW